MIIGVPKEIMNNEYRVALVPVGVEELKKRRHTILVQKGAGLGSSIPDEDYRKAGAQIVSEAREIFRRSDLIVKVKEPQETEYAYLKKGQTIFTFFHFAANKGLTLEMIKKKIVAIAYETVEDDKGRLPLLIPMSEVAGRMAVQEGAKSLEKPMFGRGILLSGAPGVNPANVVILGGGVVGSNAAKIAAGLGARVTVMDVNMERLRYLSDVMPDNVVTLMSNAHNIIDKLKEADLLIGAVLIHGARTPLLVTRKMLKLMKPGSAIVDASIDQGGCCETSKPTTHAKPTYVLDGVVHYCVSNMPGAVAGTSTYALTNVTLPYILEIADKGYAKAARENQAILKGLNLVKGKVTLKAIADLYGLKYVGSIEAVEYE